MSELYSEDEYCMDFTNEEINEYLVNPLRKYCKITIKTTTGIKEDLYTGSDKIKCVFFDGDMENFFVSFYGTQTSIFISDESLFPERKYTFNEEIMFIDDKVKMNITSSHTYGNIVYEGGLRDKTHKEILEIVVDIILILNKTKKIIVKEDVVSEEGWKYPKCNYVVKIFSESEIKNNIKFENILFIINETKL